VQRLPMTLGLMVVLCFSAQGQSGGEGSLSDKLEELKPLIRKAAYKRSCKGLSKQEFFSLVDFNETTLHIYDSLDVEESENRCCQIDTRTNVEFEARLADFGVDGVSVQAATPLSCSSPLNSLTLSTADRGAKVVFRGNRQIVVTDYNENLGVRQTTQDTPPIDGQTSKVEIFFDFEQDALNAARVLREAIVLSLPPDQREEARKQSAKLQAEWDNRKDKAKVGDDELAGDSFLNKAVVDWTIYRNGNQEFRESAVRKWEYAQKGWRSALDGARDLAQIDRLKGKLSGGGINCPSNNLNEDPCVPTQFDQICVAYGGHTCIPRSTF
jgi:hypothetical protein